MNNLVKTITARCACGVSFQREVKRGRPQVWCPKCVLVPFYERNVSNGVNDEGHTYTVVEAATVPERIVNENDELDHVRVEIDAGMFEINAAHKARYAVLVAGGLAPMDASAKALGETLAASQNLYASLAPNKYKPGRESEDV